MPKSTASASAAKPSYNIHAVEKALDLLNAICDEGGEVRLSELSERLGLNKANVFRLLATLENRGLVVRGDDARKYRLGLTAYEMGQKLLSGMSMLRKSRPVMERLARDCGEAVYMVVPCEDEALMLEMVDCCHQVKVAPLVGRRTAMSATALGRIFLACAPRNGRGKVLPLLPELQEELAAIRRLGYAEEEGGLGDGVAALGIPLYNANEQVVAVLAIVGPSFRIWTEQRRYELRQLLTDAGMAISTSLGHISPYLRSSYATG